MMVSEKIVCKECGKEFSKLFGLTTHLKKTHSYSKDDLISYSNKYIRKDIKCECDGCDNIVGIHKQEGLKIIYQKKCDSHMSYNHRRVQCSECSDVIGWQYVRSHLLKEHNYNEDMLMRYYKNNVIDKAKFICNNPNCDNETELMNAKNNSPLYTFKLKFNKYCKDHYDRSFTPTTREYWENRGLSDSEIDYKLSGISDNISKGVSDAVSSGDVLTTQKGYWLKKGYSESEAIQKLKERQTTFTKDICVSKYGKVKGKEVWKTRQNKWIATLDSKSDEEKEEISYKKGNSMRRSFLVNKHGSDKADDIIRSRMSSQSYSKISQELFVSIYNKLNKISDIYFATKHNDGVYDNDKNDEYVVHTHNGRIRFLDFYIPSLGKCIEFDGDYYHSERFFKGNKTRDLIREQEIVDTIDGIKILHIRENDYRSDKELVVQQCLDFIYNKIAI